MYRNSKPLADFYNTYTIHWTPDHYEWRFNNNTLRKLYKNQTQNYPDDTSKIQFGIWEAQPSSWAGPGIDLKEQPFVLSIESIQVSCFNTTTSNTTSNTTSTASISSPTSTTNTIPSSASITSPSASISSPTSTTTSTTTTSNGSNNYKDLSYNLLLVFATFCIM
jgi:beta-glucanase (GH16 family)